MLRHTLAGKTTFLGIGAIICLNLISCASPTTRMGTDPEVPETAKIHGAAFGADSFMFAKRMKIRAPNDFVFYFKHCELIQRRSPKAHYSQAEYGCTPPF